MEAGAQDQRVVRFGVYELDLRSGELRKHGHKIHLEGKPVIMLMKLLERPGELVTREELQKELWPEGTFVDFDQSLNAVVKRLRQALSDTPSNPRFVETLARRGYRFIAPVTPAAPVILEPPKSQREANPEPPPQEPPIPARRRVAWIAGILGFVVVLAALIAWWFESRGRFTPGIRSLAVLPLENLSGDSAQEYFSEGMTDELITELGQIRGLRVISRTSIMTYKNVHRPLPQIARELNVDAIVEGTVLRSNNQVRITAQLIQAEADKHLWAQSYEGDLRDTLALQKQVARSIAKEIRVELTPLEKAALKEAKRVKPEAFEAYLKGRYFWNKRTAAGLTKAAGYFNDAIEKDPAYAPAYAGLADSLALMGDWEYGLLAPQDAYPRSKAAAAKAIALDDFLGEAHVSLAFSLDGFDWDWDKAGREFRRGVELSPSYATGHQWYAWHLALMGKNDEALGEMRKAENLDPLSLIICADLAELYLIAHRYDESIRQSQKAIDLDPQFAVAHYELGQAYVQKQLYAEAISELQKASALSGGSVACVSNLAHAYAVSGHRGDAERILTDLRRQSVSKYSNAPEIALVYVGLKDKDQAMAWLEKAYVERFNPGVLLRPAFDSLRFDTRFQDLLRRLGLNRGVA